MMLLSTPAFDHALRTFEFFLCRGCDSSSEKDEMLRGLMKDLRLCRDFGAIAVSIPKHEQLLHQLVAKSNDVMMKGTPSICYSF